MLHAYDIACFVLRHPAALLLHIAIGYRVSSKLTRHAEMALCCTMCILPDLPIIIESTTHAHSGMCFQLNSRAQPQKVTKSELIWSEQVSVRRRCDMAGQRMWHCTQFTFTCYSLLLDAS